jgi:hypothetical protein
VQQPVGAFDQPARHRRETGRSCARLDGDYLVRREPQAGMARSDAHRVRRRERDHHGHH